MNEQLTFIDLFAGLGGFHIALKKLGCKCVFASELKDDLIELYKYNFPETNRVEGDITKVDLSTIPHHDILCAGFPCQPFSQAGKRQGFSDEKHRGNMFNYICSIIEEREKKDDKPAVLILENVANLQGHDHGNTWKVIQERLDHLGYLVKGEILSPHQFGYPQHRKRIYIVGILKELMKENNIAEIEFPTKPSNVDCRIKDIIDEKDEDIQPLSLKTHQQLKVWQQFLNELKKRNKDIPRFPIWAMEFGADYPYEKIAPYLLQKDELQGFRGKMGTVINGNTQEECLKQLPNYAQSISSQIFPRWKCRYIAQNREFAKDNLEWVFDWLRGIRTWENSHQKLEWNCKGNDNYSIKDKIVQFRASGIRVKLPTFSPALNLVGTQVPILPWIKLPKSCVLKYSSQELQEFGLTKDDILYGRYLSILEAARLQGMEDIKFGNLSKGRIYEALGNAVNTQVVYKIATKIIDQVWQKLV